MKDEENPESPLKHKGRLRPKPKPPLRAHCAPKLSSRGEVFQRFLFSLIK